jgi:hypothetical protein
MNNKTGSKLQFLPHKNFNMIFNFLYVAKLCSCTDIEQFLMAYLYIEYLCCLVAYDVQQYDPQYQLW